MRKVIIGILFLVIVSCNKNNNSNSATSTVMAKTVTNVSYGADPAQNMDIYLPAARSTASTKVIIMLHGGAWNSGDKTDISQYVDTFKRRLPEYAIFNVNYRLALNNNTVFPAQENDVDAAVKYIISHLQEYLVSNKIVLMGVSAGGHLALLEAYKNMTEIKAKAVVSLFGPTDLTDMYYNPVNQLIPFALTQILGTTPALNPDLYKASSPINYVTSTSPPTILFHGGFDNLVRPSQSTALQAKLQAAGIINQYVFYPNEGHGWYGATLSDTFDKIQNFLLLNVI